ncbi:ATP-binding protein [Saccharothrix sp. ALI-22-I]|uniref:sensor histidine kinase n=1 Tax=Saccharothrix sp. ALI-22-I TaxID=1933778 RepID=UPI00097BB063|nr:ATP-binding protein [Saccharothrix sp. ALI-22-I]ONI80684.1 ATP-binding protein [Saccharothrix sp. ALI-22-I]
MRGQVESEFLAAIARFAGPVRGVGVALISVFGVLSVPSDALPLGLGLLALVLVGAVADFGSQRLAIVLAIVRVVAVCAAQARIDGTDQWMFNVLTTTAITLQWEWSPKITVPTTAALLAVYLTAVGWDGSAVARLVVECVLARLAYRLLRRSTRRVDELRARQAALERAEAMALARRRREREYLALLHDTASATFLVVAVNGRDTDPSEVAGYARRDLDVLAGAVPTDTAVDVGSSLKPVVERSPLDIDARWDNALVPASVALALVRAVREALTNVERHAGTQAAELRVSANGDGVEVRVSDAGRGFDVDAVSDHRRGIRGSVVERMAAVGGSAEVTSRPGGTTVRLAWPRG